MFFFIYFFHCLPPFSPSALLPSASKFQGDKLAHRRYPSCLSWTSSTPSSCSTVILAGSPTVHATRILPARHRQTRLLHFTDAFGHPTPRTQFHPPHFDFETPSPSSTTNSLYPITLTLEHLNTIRVVYFHLTFASPIPPTSRHPLRSSLLPPSRRPVLVVGLS